MARTSRKCWKLIKWHSHHEPHRRIKGGLSYWLQKVHAGVGRQVMAEKFGVEDMLMAVGLFNILQQRTARLPVKYRGYLVTGQHEPASVQQLAHDLRMPEPLLARLFPILEHAKWLGQRQFKPVGRPTGNQVEPDGNRLETNGNRLEPYEDEDERRPMNTTNERRQTTDPAAAGRGSPEVSPKSLEDRSSISTSQDPGPVANAVDGMERMQKALGLDLSTVDCGRNVARQRRADATTIKSVVGHHWNGESAKPTFERVLEIAAQVRHSTSPRNIMAVWQAALKKEGLHYLAASGSGNAP